MTRSQIERILKLKLFRTIKSDVNKDLRVGDSVYPIEKKEMTLRNKKMTVLTVLYGPKLNKSLDIKKELVSVREYTMKKIANAINADSSLRRKGKNRSVSTNLVNEVSRVFDLAGGVYRNMEIIVRRGLDDDFRGRTVLWSSEVTARLRVHVEVKNVSFDSVKQVQDFFCQFRKSYYFSDDISEYENLYITKVKKKEEISQLKNRIALLEEFCEKTVEDRTSADLIEHSVSERKPLIIRTPVRNFEREVEKYYSNINRWSFSRCDFRENENQFLAERTGELDLRTCFKA